MKQRNQAYALGHIEASQVLGVRGRVEFPLLAKIRTCYVT